MSAVKSSKVQVGTSTNPSNNFVVDASQADGSFKISRGNIGSTTQEVLKIDSSGSLTVSGFPTFQCRAWVVFNGQTTVPTILAGGNVSSVSRLGTGMYRITLTTPVPSAHYAVSGSGQWDEAGTNAAVPCVGVRRWPGAMTTTTLDVVSEDLFTTNPSDIGRDAYRVSVSVFA